MYPSKCQLGNEGCRKLAFINYAETDSKAAVALHDKLENHCIFTWVASLHLENHALQNNQLKEAISETDLFILILSETLVKEITIERGRAWFCMKTVLQKLNDDILGRVLLVKMSDNYVDTKRLLGVDLVLTELFGKQKKRTFKKLVETVIKKYTF